MGQTGMSLHGLRPPLLRLKRTRKRGEDVEGHPQLQAEIEANGCLFCRVSAQAEATFFHWFVLELAGTGEMTDRLLRARGFCLKHARQLVHGASVGLLTAVYLPLVQAAAHELVEVAGGGTPGSRGVHVSCPACESLTTSLRYWAGLVERAIRSDSARWQERFLDRQALCIYHYALIRSGVGALSQAWLDKVILEGLHSETVWPLQPTPDEFCMPPSLSTPLLKRLPSREGRGWSNAWEELRTRLRADSCPVCQWLGGAAEDYLAWLREAVAHEPTSQWLQAGQLCWAHVHAWIAKTTSEASLRWRQELASWWLAQYQAAKNRQQGLSAGRRQARQGQGSLRSVIGVEESACGLCHYLGVRQEEALGLLASMLFDPRIWPVYSRSHGLCLRHLRVLLPRLSSSERLELATVHRRRLEVMAWTLERYLRLDSWSRRHEAMTYEADAWALALRTYQGELWTFEPYPRFPQ
jgi:hypothetical protein